MEKIINDTQYGEIKYYESFWTGKKAISINGTELTKIDNKHYNYVINDDGIQKNIKVLLSGNFLLGASIKIKDQLIEIYPKIKWFEIILLILPFILNIVWGNNIYLCSIIPVVGGAIGGGISGLFSGISAILMKLTENVLYKVLIGFATLIISFAICALIGLLIIQLL